MVVYAIVNGVSYNLSDDTYCRVVAFDGLDTAPVRRLTERGPQQHGDSDVGFRLDPRFFNLVLVAVSSDRSAYYTNRRTLLNIFAPREEAMVVKFVLDNGDTRQIDAHLVGQPQWTADASEAYLVGRMGVQFRAADPTMYDPVEGSVVFALGGGSDAWEIPWVIPWEIGAAALDQTVTIQYAGNWRTYPIVKIEGPITNAIIVNETTGEKLDFTGVTISAGDHYEIDCRYGQKTVVDSAGTNKIADLSSDSDLATFHLEPIRGNESYRTNDINVTGSAVTEATEVYFRYRIRHTGL